MKKPILISGKQCSGKSQLVETIMSFTKKPATCIYLANKNLFEIFQDIFKHQSPNYVFEEILSFRQIINLERFFIRNSLNHINRIYVVDNSLIPNNINIKVNQKIEVYFNWIPLSRYQDIFQQTNKQKLVQEIDAFLGLHSTKINHGFPYMLPKYFFQFRIEKKRPKILLDYNAGNKTADDFLKKHWCRNETF